MTGELVPEAELRSYYDRPILKRPVWSWEIPAYFFTGGLAAGSSLISLGAQLIGARDLGRRAAVTAAASVTVSAGLLVADLGRPARFHHMLRVFRPTSPMSVGSWVLAGYGPAAAISAVGQVLGWWPRGRVVAGVAAGALAPVVGNYTAVLLSDTAVPAWHDARRELPYVFAGGVASSAGGAALIYGPAPSLARLRTLGVAGALLELAASRAMHRRLGPLAAPYREPGRARTLSRTAAGLSMLGSVVAMVGRRRRLATAAAGGLLVAGAAVERFAVFEAGVASAQDPQATIAPQRARVGDRAPVTAQQV